MGLKDIMEALMHHAGKVDDAAVYALTHDLGDEAGEDSETKKKKKLEYLEDE